jgi:hypothetical protein
MFADSLRATLTLTIDGGDFEIPASSISSMSLDLELWGGSADVEFWCVDDTGVGGERSDDLFEPFVGSALIEVSLSVASVYLERTIEQPPPAIEFRGVVTKRSLAEEHSASLPVYRWYSIRVEDPAAAVWKQHYPTELVTETSIKKLVEAHRGERFEVDFDWPRVDVTMPFAFLALGCDGNSASFYDFLIAWVRQHDGHWLFDGVEKTYGLCEKKSADGTPGNLALEDVAEVRIDLNEPVRFEPHILNSFVDGIKNETVSNTDANSGMRRDHLVWEAVAADFDERKTLETQRVRTPLHGLHVAFSAWPKEAVQPGSLVTMAGGEWSPAAYHHDLEYRAIGLRLRAVAVETEVDRNRGDEVAGFSIEFQVSLEASADETPRLPVSEEPGYPALVEGVIVSDQGAEDQETWEVYEASGSAVPQYRVRVPLWDDQVVGVDLRPDLFSGHFWHPAYKGERVLLAFWFDAVRIERFVDWRAGARGPQEEQGNRLMMGKNESDFSRMSHSYVDAKPVFSIERRLEKDVGLIRVEEGTMTLRIEEES